MFDRHFFLFLGFCTALTVFPMEEISGIYYTKIEGETNNLYRLEISETLNKLLIKSDLDEFIIFIIYNNNSIMFYDIKKEAIENIDIGTGHQEIIYKCSYCEYIDSNNRYSIFKDEKDKVIMIDLLSGDISHNVLSNEKEKIMNLRISPDSKRLAYYILKNNGTYNLIIFDIKEAKRKVIKKRIDCYVSDLSSCLPARPPLIWIDNNTIIYQNSKSKKEAYHQLIGIDIRNKNKKFIIETPKHKVEKYINLGYNQLLSKNIDGKIIYTLGGFNDYYLDIEKKEIIPKNHEIKVEIQKGKYRIFIEGKKDDCSIKVYTEDGQIVFKDKGISKIKFY